MNFLEKIIDEIDRLKVTSVKELYGGCHIIVAMIDKIEDDFIDNNNYKTEIKNNIRYLRYIMYTTPFANPACIKSNIDKAMDCASDLKKEFKEVEE